MKNIRIWKLFAMVLLLLSLFCTIDLGLNVLYNAEPALHDGSFMTWSVLHAVLGIFGDSLWSFERFFRALNHSAWTTFALVAINAGLHFCRERE